MKRYEFTITISGDGDDVKSAWQDAVDSLHAEPGEAPAYEAETNEISKETEFYRVSDD